MGIPQIPHATVNANSSQIFASRSTIPTPLPVSYRSSPSAASPAETILPADASPTQGRQTPASTLHLSTSPTVTVPQVGSDGLLKLPTTTTIGSIKLTPNTVVATNMPSPIGIGS